MTKRDITNFIKQHTGETIPKLLFVRAAVGKYPMKEHTYYDCHIIGIKKHMDMPCVEWEFRIAPGAEPVNWSYATLDEILTLKIEEA